MSVRETAMTDTRTKFIADHAALFWHTPESRKGNVSDALLVETIMNYGTLDDFREMRRVLGEDRVADAFFSVNGRKVGNYFPEIRNFFSLVLKNHAR